jgi:hypothetical protein
VCRIVLWFWECLVSDWVVFEALNIEMRSPMSAEAFTLGISFAVLFGITLAERGSDAALRARLA